MSRCGTRSPVAGCGPRGVYSDLEVNKMRVLDELVPIIADIIGAHCAGTRAREEFIRACLRMDWTEAQAMVQGMLAEPWHLIGHQESRLRQFLELMQLVQGESASSIADRLAA